MTSILAISGSLRRASINARLLSAIALVAAEDKSVAAASVKTCSIIGYLPLFNPDLDGREPAIVHEFRSALKAADAIVIASPEYAHGITGVMKNALDWIVGSGEFVEKPTAILNAAPRSSVAFEALNEVLRTMDANIILEASLDIPVLGKNLDEMQLSQDADIRPLLEKVISSLVGAIS